MELPKEESKRIGAHSERGATNGAVLPHCRKNGRGLASHDLHVALGSSIKRHEARTRCCTCGRPAQEAAQRNSRLLRVASPGRERTTCPQPRVGSWRRRGWEQKCAGKPTGMQRPDAHIHVGRDTPTTTPTLKLCGRGICASNSTPTSPLRLFHSGALMLAALKGNALKRVTSELQPGRQ